MRSKKMFIHELGWNDQFNEKFREYEEKGFIPGRIATEQKNVFYVLTETGEYKSIISDSLFKNAFYRSDLPVTGDWVALSNREGYDNLIIEKVLERSTKISRKRVSASGRKFNKPGTSEEQILVTNVDVIFFVMALDRDFKLRKLERYLTLIWDSGANPVIILNKSDECSNPDKYRLEAESVSCGVPVHVTSAKYSSGIFELLQYLETGKTGAFIGSSGVGKTSVINALLDEEKMYINKTREGDSRGKHTTTHRELIILPQGGVLVDNPGLRDVKLVATDESLDHTFADIAELSNQCKFRNCTHQTEPKCAVLQAIMTGKLSEERLGNYFKLQRELDHFSKRKYFRTKYEDSGKWKEDKLKRKKVQHTAGVKGQKVTDVVAGN